MATMTERSRYAQKVGARITKARGDRSQKWLASNVWPGSNPESRRNDIIRYEKGRVLAGAGVLTRIAEACGVSVSYLLGETEEEDDEEADRLRHAIEQFVAALRPRPVTTEAGASMPIESAPASE